MEKRKLRLVSTTDQPQMGLAAGEIFAELKELVEAREFVGRFVQHFHAGIKKMIVEEWPGAELRMALFALTKLQEDGTVRFDAKAWASGLGREKSQVYELRVKLLDRGFFLEREGELYINPNHAWSGSADDLLTMRRIVRLELVKK